MWFKKKKVKVVDPNELLREQLRRNQELNVSIARAEKKLKDLENVKEKHLTEAANARRNGNESLFRVKLTSLKNAVAGYENLSQTLNVFYALKDKKELNEIMVDLIGTFSNVLQPLVSLTNDPVYTKGLEDLSKASNNIEVEALLINGVLDKINDSMESSLGQTGKMDSSLLSMIDEKIRLEEEKEKTQLMADELAKAKQF